jgi:Rrf2 family protein
MLRVSKKLVFATEAVLDIAYHAGSTPVQSGQITARQGIPRRYLEPVLQQLVRTGILAGVRGPRGGYRLARDRRQIVVGDIVRAIGAMEDAEGFEDAAGSALGQAVIKPLWADITGEFMKRLDEITIEQLCARARAAGIEAESDLNVDFVI